MMKRDENLSSQEEENSKLKKRREVYVRKIIKLFHW